jgi:hypothetical protein
MQCFRRDLDPCVYLLVEHLDAALAAGESLTSLTMEVTEPSADMGPRRLRSREARFIGFVNQVRGIEASLIAHVIQARRRAGELPRARGPLKTLLDSFSGGTAVLIDAVAEYGDPATFAFNTGADRLTYLRTRAILKGDSGALMPMSSVEIGEGFRVAGRLELGPLMDMVEAFLGALNDQFDLWRERPDDDTPLEPTLSLPGPGLAEQIATARAAVAAANDIDPATGVRRSLLAALSQLEQRRTPGE